MPLAKNNFYFNNQFYFWFTYRCPWILKSHSMPLWFYETHTFVPAFINGKKFKEDFCFYEKKKMKNENSVQHLFCRKKAIRWVPCPSAGGVDPTKFLPQTLHSASEHQATTGLNWVSIWALSEFILCIC